MKEMGETRFGLVAQGDAAHALKVMESRFAGLTIREVEERRQRHGKNEVAHEKPPTWYVQLVKAVANPFNAVLAVLAVISVITDVIIPGPAEADWTQVIILAAMVSVSGLLRFWQEFRSQREAEQLKELVQTTVAAQRYDPEGKGPVTNEVPLEELVPGDIVHLAAGDLIPADLRLLSAKDLFVSQAALTCESIPVEKYAHPQAAPSVAEEDGALGANPLELATLCFMGTNVVSGTATAVVIATGSATLFGSMAGSLTGARPLTSFDQGVNRVSWVLIRFMLVMVPVVFVLNGITKGNWTAAFFFALAVAVGLTPEMLPMVVTANLAKGALRMSKKQVIVKRLNAIQNFGAMDILCTDKTGTLTEDRVVLVQHLDVHGDESLHVLDLAYLNSANQTGLRNLIDRAVIDHTVAEGRHERAERYTKVDEIPFDFMRRRMSVVVQAEDGSHLLICKGAVEELLDICRYVEQADEVMSLTEAFRQEVAALARKLNKDGLRALAVAYRRFLEGRAQYAVQDEQEMVLAGYVGFLDPAKASAADALEALTLHGVAVKILTGDNELVTAKVCRDVGLDAGQIVLGHEIDHLDHEELAALAERTHVFAKVNPLQKARVIRALREKQHTVGYMGDGINDAPSLREADVGISVDTAVDVAKESADIILLEKSLMVLEAGVVEGRTVFGNIIKYIKMTASSNFGSVFSVLVASAFLPFLPMLPLQLLVQNLLYDLSQISLPWDRMDAAFLARPRKWEADSIARFMIWIGPTSSIFDITTFLLMWYVFGANSFASQSLFQSGWFIEGLLSQTLIVHMIRTRKIPFIQSTASWPVMLLTILTMGVGALIPFTSFGASLGLEPVPLAYFPWLAAILLAYFGLTQVVKTWYVRRFNVWL